MLWRRSEERELVSPLEVDKELAADGRLSYSNAIRSEIRVNEPMVKAHSS